SQDVAAGTITYVDEAGNPTLLKISDIIAQHETLTSASFDAATGILTYNDEAGTANTIDLSTMVANFETLTSISQDAAAGTITYVDEVGNPTVLNIADIIAQHETTTTLVNNNDGTYTYTSEDGTVTVVDVPADVVNQFDTIVNSGPVTVDGTTYTSVEEYFETIVTSNSDVLVDNGDGTFTHTAADGTVVTFDANSTAMVNNDHRTYNYNNTNGETQTINYVGDIINNIELFVSNSPVTVDG